MTPDIVDRLRRVLAAVSESSIGSTERAVDPLRIRPQDTLDVDLGFNEDSLSMLELQYALEKEFRIRKEIKRALRRLPDWPPVTVADVARAVTEALEVSKPD